MAKLLMGNEAFAHAALEAGVCVVAGYPGTPSSEVVETVAKLRASGSAAGVHVEWSTNEKAALELAAGASLSGARALFTCKQVGLNVASDPLMSLNYVGVKGGLVLFVADDPGPISSQTEQDTRRFAAFAKVPVLDPATPEQGFAMMKEAFELSERYGTPVILRATTRICHASAFFDVAERTEARRIADGGFRRDARWIIFPRRSFEAHGEIVDRLDRIACDPALAGFNIVHEGGAQAEAPADAGAPAGAGGAGGGNVGNPRFGILAGGVSAAYALDALALLEARATASSSDTAPAPGARAASGAPGARMLPAYRFMQAGTPYPFPAQAVAEFARGLENILVLEELDSTLEEQLLAYAGRTHASFDVAGKLTGEVPVRGELSVDIAADVIARFLGTEPLAGNAATGRRKPKRCRHAPDFFDEEEAAEMIARAKTEELLSDLPARPPVLCAGCPHRGSFYAVKRALGKTPGIFCGDIGCYTLGNARPLDAVDTCLCMGAGITMAQGFAVAERMAAAAKAGAKAGAAPDTAAGATDAPAGDSALAGNPFGESADKAAVPVPKCIAFVGDSTFFASGMTGLANAAYNGHDITVCVLDNATTAMTGGQPHPGTGITLMGERRQALSLRSVLEALGFDCIEEADPLNIDEASAAAKRALDVAGPSAVIFRSPCIQLSRPETPVAVDTQSCTGCKRCIAKIGCPAIGFDTAARGPLSANRGQAFVDPSLCFGCDLCTQICPVHALKKTAPATGGEAEVAAVAPAPAEAAETAAAPEPAPAAAAPAGAATSAEPRTDAASPATASAEAPADPAAVAGADTKEETHA